MLQKHMQNLLGVSEQERWLKRKGAHFIKAFWRGAKGNYKETTQDLWYNKGLTFLVHPGSWIVYSATFSGIFGGGF